MKVGDLIKRKKFMDADHCHGVIVGFDSDGDPLIYWNGDLIEEEYASAVEVISESR